MFKGRYTELNNSDLNGRLQIIDINIRTMLSDQSWCHKDSENGTDDTGHGLQTVLGKWKLLRKLFSLNVIKTNYKDKKDILSVNLFPTISRTRFFHTSTSIQRRKNAQWFVIECEIWLYWGFYIDTNNYRVIVYFKIITTKGLFVSLPFKHMDVFFFRWHILFIWEANTCLGKQQHFYWARIFH